MPSNRLRAAILILAVGVMTTRPAHAADTAWTIRDVSIVADVVVAESEGDKEQGILLIQLAEALAKAGASARARDTLVKTNSLLGPVDSFASIAHRQRIIRQLVKLGDDAQAEALADGDLSPLFKVMRSGELGVARAQAGNIEGAKKAAAAISSLGAVADPNIPRHIEFALKNIGIALVENGAPDEAVQVANGIPSKAAALLVVARAAATHCATSKDGKGHDLARRAADEARAAAAGSDQYNFITEPIIEASAAVTACSGLRSAVEFVRDAIPPQAPSQMWPTLITQLSNKSQIELALALAPPPRPGDSWGFIDHARRLKTAGDLSGATAAALEASRIVVSLKDWSGDVARARLGSIVKLLATLGAYDAAIETTDVSPADRGAWYVMIAATAIDAKDAHNIARLTSNALKALSEPAPNGRPLTHSLLLLDLLRLLATNGYRDDARPIFERLSRADSALNTIQPNRVASLALTEVRALMNDVAGALMAAEEAGPMVAEPDALRAVVAATMQFAGRSQRPTEDEFKAAMQAAIKALPPAVEGPKAHALAIVARELAKQRNIAGALQAAAELDVEPRDILAPRLGEALFAIADAQMAVGDLHGALATTLRMTKGPSRLNTLLKLAAYRPSP